MAISDKELPRASVVVPVLDAASEIGRLLDSLTALDYPPGRLEVIVVDNGSTDGTPDLVSRHPVRLLHETATRSSYAARNRGAAAASGEWVVFTDADCFAPPDWLRRLLAPVIPETVGAVAGEVLALEATTAVQRLTERFGIMKHEVTLPHKSLPGFSTANVAVRRELLLSLGGFREDVRFFGDMELSWRMQLEAGAGLLFRPEAIVRHRHRRTLRELWRQGRQHGRGVAFMKTTYPDHYRISLAEQLSRIGSIAGLTLRAFAGGSAGDHPLSPRPRRTQGSASRQRRPRAPVTGAPEAVNGAEAQTNAGSDSGPDGRPDRDSIDAGRSRDSFYAPLFLTVWYGGMCAGYLMGPAWSRKNTRTGFRATR